MRKRGLTPRGGMRMRNETRRGGVSLASGVGVLQECWIRMFDRVSHESAARHKRQARVFSRAPQECAARMSHRTVAPQVSSASFRR